MSGKKEYAPSADRNKDPILKILQKHLPGLDKKDQQLNCLEIASGTGQHVVHFAQHFPFITFQPSEQSLSSLPSIRAYIADSGLSNVLPPLVIDVTQPVDKWNLARQEYDLIININMIHISPWACTIALFSRAAQLLAPNGILVTYGPYAVNGVISPESNVAFDLSLRSRHSEWGLRDVEDLKKVGQDNGFQLEAVEEMPSNNKTLIWRKS